MKTSVINTRISNKMKDELELYGKVNGEATSKIVREAIEVYLNINKINQLPDNKLEGQKPMEKDILQIKGFSEFIFWICENRMCQNDKLDMACYSFINLIDKLKSHPKITTEILAEFMKISNELTSIMNEQSEYDKYMFISIGFDYDKLTKFMHDLRYEIYEINMGRAKF